MDSINCFDCKTWCDEDLTVHYPKEGLYRCYECAYKHEKKTNTELLEALKLSQEFLKQVMPLLPNSGYGWLQGKVDARIIRNRALLEKLEA